MTRFAIFLRAAGVGQAGVSVLLVLPSAELFLNTLEQNWRGVLCRT